jgi:hypothetical protein
MWMRPICERLRLSALDVAGTARKFPAAHIYEEEPWT